MAVPSVMGLVMSCGSLGEGEDWGLFSGEVSGDLLCSCMLLCVFMCGETSV